jgi:hypothetical protein
MNTRRKEVKEITLSRTQVLGVCLFYAILLTGTFLLGVGYEKTLVDPNTQVVKCGKISVRVKVDKIYPQKMVQEIVCPEICEGTK